MRRQLQNRVPDRLRETDEPVRGGARDRPAANLYFPARRRWAPAGLWGNREVPKRSALARLPAVLRILPRRQWRWNWRQPPNRMDRCCRHSDRDFRQARWRGSSKGWQRGAIWTIGGADIGGNA